MADAAKVIEGPVREWLAARREELNARFRQAQRRHPRLDGARVLGLVSELLPPLADSDEGRDAELFASVYDLILLHAARERLEAHDGALDVLLRKTFPSLRPLLLQRPKPLCAALSNAVENLGAQGLIFAERLPVAAASLQHADELLDAGAVLAWRLGEARLRDAALSVAAKLPSRTVLASLVLGGWPDEAAPLVLAGLRSRGWTEPTALFDPATLDQLPRLTKPQRDALRQRIDTSTSDAPWCPAATVGEFAGFGGAFEAPPLLLALKEVSSRHRFHVRAGEQVYRLDADVYGWRCGRHPGTGGVVREVLKTRREGTAALLTNGRLQREDGTTAVPGAQGAVSFHLARDLVAFTLAESFRIRVVVPVRAPL